MAGKLDKDHLITEIASFRDSLELKQELTNLRIEVAQLRHEIAHLSGQLPNGTQRKLKQKVSGQRPTQD